MNPGTQTKDIIELTEWKEEVLVYYWKDYDYLNREFKDTLTYREMGKNSLVKTKQFVGIIRLPGSKKILKIHPKTISRYMELLRYAQSIKCNDSKRFFHFDLKERVEAEEGSVFLEIIANLFLIEIKHIFKRGLYKEYVKKEENMNFLRGKLLIHKQIRKNFIKPKFYCNYFDLTVDNFVNQAMLYAALKVTKLIDCGLNPDLKKLRAEILKYVKLLKDEIALKDTILFSELTNLSINRKNDYYAEILDLTKIIISESFFGSSGQRKSKCCNFLIDMNVIFERVVFGLLNKILEGKEYFVTDQVTSFARDFVCINNKSLKIIPDIIIHRGKKEYAVVDAKYMASVKNQEYFQIITYSLALRIKTKEHFKTAILINFEPDVNNTKVNEGAIKIANLTDRPEDEDIKIYQIPIYLGNDEGNYINQIENQLRDSIKKCKIFENL